MAKFSFKLTEHSDDSGKVTPDPSVESNTTETPPTGSAEPGLSSATPFRYPKVVRIAWVKAKRLSQQIEQRSPIFKWVQNTWGLMNRDRPLYRSKLFWAGMGTGLGIGSPIVAFNLLIYSIDLSLPNPSEVLSFVRDDTLTIMAGDGTILQQRGPATREKLRLQEIPLTLQQAFVASEDRRFRNHHGVDYRAIARAMLANLQRGGVAEGASTITQQLARIVFLNQETSLKRKLIEARLARKIEDQLTKDQILERYLNLVYLGSGAYGVADAAWVYFTKPVEKLTLPEMAMIAGLPPAPSEYSPIENPDLARKRRNLVLQRMVSAQVITASEAEQASATDLVLKPSPPKRFNVEAPYFNAYIKQELSQYLTPEQIKEGGLIVQTSLNRKWQEAAEKAIRNAVDLDGPGQGFEQAALVAIDPRNGEIQAMVGGKDFDNYQFNRATQAQRQPGSTFKTLVYTTAIAAGFSPYDSYLDGFYSVDGYTPKNYGNSHRGWMSMRDALISSINIIAVQVLVDVGFEPVINMAHQMGIKSPLKPYYAMALGSQEVNLLELTNAYGTLAAQGKYIEAHGIRRVINNKGQILFNANNQFKSKQVVDKNTTSIMTWMLEGVVTSGTGTPAQLPDRAVAGKTGTSEQARDLWFIGFIPQMVAGVWLGNDDNYPTWGSSATAAYAWGEFMREVTKGMSVQEFPKLPTLEGRKGSIKAKPAKPKRVTLTEAAPPPSQDSNRYYDDPGNNPDTGYNDPPADQGEYSNDGNW